MPWAYVAGPGLKTVAWGQRLHFIFEVRLYDCIEGQIRKGISSPEGPLRTWPTSLLVSADGGERCDQLLALGPQPVDRQVHSIARL